jgi:hypothetical protein
VVSSVGGQTAANVASGASAANNAASANTANAIVKRDGSGDFTAGTITATSFSGNGASLTSLNAGNLSSGTVSDARLSANVAQLNSNQTFTASNIFSGVVALTNNTNTIVGTVSGNGAGLTNLAAANLTGTLPSAQLSGTYSGALTFNNAGNSFSGSGANLTSLNASQLGSGTVPAAALGNAWQTGGNSGTTPGTHYVGTADNQALEVKVNSTRALRLEPNTSGAPNFIAGSPRNFVGASVVGAVIGGGGATNASGVAYTNSVLDSFGTVGGGRGNFIRDGAASSTISGGSGNSILTNASAAFIGGGSGNIIRNGAAGSAIGGGTGNLILTNAAASFIGGGNANQIATAASSSVIGGGEMNVIQASADHAFIGGGSVNQIDSSAIYSTIAGGNGGHIEASAQFSSIGGGGANDIQAGAFAAAISGGFLNVVGGNTAYSTIGGGELNSIVLSATDATIGGGNGNTVSGSYGVVPGGDQNTAAGVASFAAGRRAKANHQGSFVWGDSTQADFTSSAINQFLIRAGGGVGIGKNNPATALDVNGTVTATAFVGDGSALTGVPRLTADQTFSGTNAFTNVGNIFVGTFAGDGTALTNLNASSLASGTLADARLAGTYSSALTLNNAANGFTGNGANLTGLWRLGGNTSTTNGTHFLGTLDNQALDVRVNNLRALRLEPNLSGAPNVVGGAPVNFVSIGMVGATISGGGATNADGIAYTNSVESDFGAIGGGGGNAIRGNSANAVIAGGSMNTILAGANSSSIGGGSQNTIEVNAYKSVIGGGDQNDIQSGAINSVIGGGYQNLIQVNANHATLCGGVQNALQNGATASTIGGGYYNVIQNNAYDCVVAGGSGNTIQTTAYFSAIAGGSLNVSTGPYSFVAGGDRNTAGTNSFAAGRRARANHTGSFVWGDDTEADIASTSTNEFTVRATGGARFLTDTLGSGVSLAPSGVSWQAISDRNAKKNFQPLDTGDVLERLAQVPVQRWSYKWEADGAVQHIGPVAQDFKAAFYPGRDDKAISTLEFDGVELAAIQGLNHKVEAQKAELEAKQQQIESLKKHNDDLARRLSSLEEAVKALARVQNGGGQ